MLVLPEFGFQRSTTAHNVDLDVLTDWIEASVVFIDSELSRNEVIDVLRENDIYEKQDFAEEIVGWAWNELERRVDTVGDGASFVVEGRRVRRIVEWPDNAAYSFCVLLTVQVLHRSWARQFGMNFTEQGALFEEIIAETLEYFGWTVFRTGWAPGNEAKIKQVVQDVSTHIGEGEISGEVEKWFAEDGNEEQLDIVCSDPFYDEVGGRPLYFFQCASGANWIHKLHTPDPESWRRVISFTTIPQRGFAIPFSLLNDDFRRRAGKINGMLLDRFRIQAPSYGGDRNWLSDGLRDRIREWMLPRVDKLPDDRR